jgi:formiminoglutamate deiminase
VTGKPGEFFAERAWLGPEQGLATGVLIEHDAGGIITKVRACVNGSSLGPSVRRLRGEVCLPGFVNAHSHAFHRALRGLCQARAGDLSAWRSLVYEVASRLTPESYHDLATAVYAEMLLAGYTSVGEFQYLHHEPGGRPYSDTNAMALALLGSATASRIRMTLLDTCYLRAGVDGALLEGPELRFGDGTGERWAGRFAHLASVPLEATQRLGAAIHSVRAVPPPAMSTVVAVAHEHDLPLHFHLSEQRSENEQCLKVLGLTPTDVLHDAGALTRQATAVHAIHLTAGDIGRLGLASCGICACPTTERDLGDGAGPFTDLADAGAVLSIGSGSHAVIDPFEETRAVDLNERLSQERRGLWQVGNLLEAGTSGGSRSLAWPTGGIAAGAMADLVTVRLGSPRLAGCNVAADPARDAADELLARIIFCAAPSDVDTVVVAGEVVVEGGEHSTLGPPAAVAERLRKTVTVALGAGV